MARGIRPIKAGLDRGELATGTLVLRDAAITVIVSAFLGFLANLGLGPVIGLLVAIVLALLLGLGAFLWERRARHIRLQSAPIGKVAQAVALAAKTMDTQGLDDPLPSVLPKTAQFAKAIGESALGSVRPSQSDVPAWVEVSRARHWIEADQHAERGKRLRALLVEGRVLNQRLIGGKFSGITKEQTDAAVLGWREKVSAELKSMPGVLQEFLNASPNTWTAIASESTELMYMDGYLDALQAIVGAW